MSINDITPGQERDESAENKKKHNSTKVREFIKSSVKSYFGNTVDPFLLNKYIKKGEKDKTLEEIITHSRGVKYDNPDLYGDISEDELHHEEIEVEVQLYIQSMLLLRKKALNFALEVVPKFKNIGADWKERLEDELSTLKQSELSNLLMNKGKMRVFLKRNFQDLEILSNDDSIKFKEIFHDYETYADEEEKRKLFTIIQNNERYSQHMSSDDVSVILKVYRNAPSQRKIDILSGLGARFTVAFALEKGLIDTDDVENLLEDLYGEEYRKLTGEKKLEVRTVLLRQRESILTANDLKSESLSQLFLHKATQKELRDHIEESVILSQGFNTTQDREPTLSQKLVQKHNQTVKEARERGEEKSEDFDMYDLFLDHISTIKKHDNTPLIADMEKLREVGSLIRFDHREYGTQFIRIKEVRNPNGGPLEIDNGQDTGITVELLSIHDGQLLASKEASYTYDNLLKVLGSYTAVRGVTSKEFDSLFQEGGQLVDKRTLLGGAVTAENIGEKLNTIDENGREIGFKKGTYFLITNEGEEEIWSVHDIKGNEIDIMAPNGFVIKGVKLEDFYTIVNQDDFQTFERLGNIEDNDGFVKSLGTFGLTSGAKIDSKKLMMSVADDHGKEHPQEVACFADNDGGHIRINMMDNGLVNFGEFDPGTNTKEKIKQYAEKHGYDEKVKKMYNTRTLSYPAFLAYLKKNKLRASDKDLILPDAHEHTHHEHYHAHTHGSFINRIMRMQSPATIMKGFELFFHSIEHTLEKGSKLDAARFAMGTAKFLHLDSTSVGAQVYADITTASKEIVEKYEQKIFGLPGPAGRWKALHIVHNTDSRPEEVVAAINYMMKSYGHLYAEDVRNYQSVVNKESIARADVGYFAFLDAFILSTRIGSVQTYRKKAYEKAITEMGSEANHENEPTEEQLIHALMKNVDGNWGEFPYAASVVKAIGGPSGYEKNWKFEGFDNAKKKGLDQTKMVNAGGRVNKGLGYFKTHEIYKAIGAMEAVAMKSKSPEHQVLPFIWCVGGYSRFASHHSLQIIKNYSETSYTFHAFAFMRNADENEKYTRGVEIALKDIGGEKALAEFQEIRKNMMLDPTIMSDEQIKKQGKAFENMAEFWVKWSKLGLHDYLQGHNGKLLKKARDGDNDMHAYLNVLNSKHSMSLNDSNIPSGELGKDWYDEHGLRMNRIMSFDENAGLYSLKRTLNKIQLYGTRTGDKEMKTNEYEKLWQGVVEQMKNIRNAGSFDGDKKLQKEQYLHYRRELLEYFMRQHQAGSGNFSDEDIERFVSAPHPYLDDLRNMGIDPREIFNQSLAEERGESDYSNWMNKISSGIVRKKRNIPDIEGDFQEKIHGTLGLNTGKHAKKALSTSGTMGRDDDTLYGGGIQEASMTE